MMSKDKHVFFHCSRPSAFDTFTDVELDEEAPTYRDAIGRRVKSLHETKAGLGLT